MSTIDSLPVWMDPVEFSQLLAIVATQHPRRCLEWGSGGSTRALLERCRFIEQYVSIEHDAQWHAKVRGLGVDPRLALHLVVPDQPPAPAARSEEDMVAWAAGAETDPAVLSSYVRFPTQLGTPFDLVLVDGRARRFCLQVGFELLRPAGVIVLHDAQRTEYHDALYAIGEPVFLEPWQQGQIALVRKPDA